MALKLSWVFLLALLFSSQLLAVRAQDDEAAIADDEDDYADAEETAERAFLIVRKYIKEELAIQGENVTVFVEIYNAGTSVAKSVKLADSPLPDNAKLAEGKLSATYDEISVGDTASNTYVLEAVKGEAPLYLGGATVTYEAEENVKQVGKSGEVGVYVMTPMQQIRRNALIAGRYVSLGMAQTPGDWLNLVLGVLFIGGLFFVNWLIKTVSTSQKDRKRAKALQELEKEAKME